MRKTLARCDEEKIGLVSAATAAAVDDNGDTAETVSIGGVHGMPSPVKRIYTVSLTPSYPFNQKNVSSNNQCPDQSSFTLRSSCAYAQPEGKHDWCAPPTPIYGFALRMLAVRI